MAYLMHRLKDMRIMVSHIPGNYILEHSLFFME
jgi:hypothetical protein